MDKQSTIAFVLIGVILVVWLYFNSPQPQPQVASGPDSTIVDQQKEVQPIEPVPIEKEIVQTTTDSTFIVSDVEEQIVTIETDLIKVLMTNKGGKIQKYYLKKYNTWYHKKKDILGKIGGDTFENKHVQLINQIENGDFNIRFVTQDGQLINSSSLDFETAASDDYYKVENGDSLSIEYTYEVSEGKSFSKIFTFFSDDYASRVDIEMNNMNDLISSYRYDVEWSTGVNFLEENSVDEASFSSASAFTGGEQVIIDASSEGETEKKEFNGYIDWIGIRNMYFGVIISPKVPFDGGAYIEGTNKSHPRWGTREYYSTALKVPFKNINYQKDSFNLFIGPLDYDILKSYEKNYEQIYDFGSFFGLKIITRPISEYILLPLFKFLHMFIPNYGIVIILFSLIIKIALYPLTKQSYQSMKRMQQLQPKIAELKEKYTNDPQKVQKETMKMYSTYGVNPMGGCLPMVLQMPILFALFTFFKTTIDIRHEPFIWWITNLSSPDIIYTLPFKLPFIGMDKISGLAILLGITMFFQQKMTVKDPSQKAMVYAMPVMFTFMFMGFASGLNLYYFMFNLFSIIQQQWINVKGGTAELQPVKNPKKKGGFMSKMMDAAEQKQKQQQSAKQPPTKKKKKF
ncbi:MAG: membrane protein insertase YidC [Melioribacteraceae bacterium]|nr:membrane protein insertase YidC [Melioribacteraceae bacterium]